MVSNGLLVLPADAESLALAIIRLHDVQVELRAAIGQEAQRDHAKENATRGPASPVSSKWCYASQ